MNIDITRQSLFNTILYFVLLFILIWSRELFFDVPLSNITIPDYNGYNGVMPLVQLIQGTLKHISIYVLMSLYLGLLFYNSFFITRIVIRKVLFVNRRYVPAIIYLVYCSCKEQSVDILSQVVVLFILMSLEGFLSVDKNKSSVDIIFRSSFYLGMASLLYMPVIIFLPALLIAPLILNYFSFKKFVVILAGFFVPIFLYSYVSWLIDGNFAIYMQNVIQISKDIFMNYNTDAVSMNIIMYLFIGMTTFLMMYFFSYFVKDFANINVQTINSVVVIIIMFALIIVSVALSFSIVGVMIPIMAIPITVLLSVLMQHIKKDFVVKILFFIIVLLMLIINIF